MALSVLTNCFVSVNGVDLSDHVVQVAVDHGAKAEDATVMGNDTENFLAGLKVSKFEVTFRQDEAAAKVNATLFPLVGPGIAAFNVILRPVNSARSATNPDYNMYCMLESFPPLGVTVGKVADLKAVFRPAGGTQATMVRTASA